MRICKAIICCHCNLCGREDEPRMTEEEKKLQMKEYREFLKKLENRRNL